MGRSDAAAASPEAGPSLDLLALEAAPVEDLSLASAAERSADFRKVDSFLHAYMELKQTFDTQQFTGFRLGDFEIGAELGNGAYGQVFRCKAKSNGVAYAIKKLWDLRIENLGKREYEIPARYPHENIIHTVHCFQDVTIQKSDAEKVVGEGRTTYFVMELFPQSLDKYIASRHAPLPEREALLILLQMLRPFDIFTAAEYATATSS